MLLNRVHYFIPFIIIHIIYYLFVTYILSQPIRVGVVGIAIRVCYTQRAALQLLVVAPGLIAEPGISKCKRGSQTETTEPDPKPEWTWGTR